jgi:hypothetical protein
LAAAVFESPSRAVRFFQIDAEIAILPLRFQAGTACRFLYPKRAMRTLRNRRVPGWARRFQAGTEHWHEREE